MSVWALWIPEDKKIMISNQVKFAEHEFPFLTWKMVDRFLSDNSTDILYQHASDVTWVRYNKLHVGNYEKVHYDTMSDVVVLKVTSVILTHSVCTYKKMDAIYARIFDKYTNIYVNTCTVRMLHV